MVDALVLGTSVAMRGGSSPLLPTILYNLMDFVFEKIEVLDCYILIHISAIQNYIIF